MRGNMKLGKMASMTIVVAIALWATSSTLVAADGPADTASIPVGLPATPDYVLGPHRSHAPVIRVYKDSNAWFGEDRDSSSLLSLGKILGDDWFVHPISDCSTGIPAGTAVVLFTSNGFGLPSATANQNASACQSNLASFLSSGGVLIVDMGDNDFAGGFMAPGSTGTPSYIFPSPPADATLTAAAAGPDSTLGTADDHPIVKGPDGSAGTSDDLTNSNIDMCCFVAHGNLADGITLPGSATALMTAQFGDIAQPILAEYCQGSGRVILDTITKEFVGHEPPGTGPSLFLRSLLSYALSPAAACNRPPDCSAAAASPNALWPPNHKLHTVTVSGITDPDSDPVTTTITGVTQDEPTNGAGDGDKSPDAANLAGNQVDLRAERSGLGDGRVYRIAVMGDDGKGGTCTATVTVSVPHDQDGAPAVDSEPPSFDSFVS